ncbi:MAG: tRNA pseudouridine(13) synthase TruD [Planctomycetes bacterium]|nr:tRNA pseudouridine(13) synthase TruD [Planctomycetota bacterium]
MKLKQLPEDFLVDEQAEFTPDPAGKFFVYELDKTSISTLEAMQQLARNAGLKIRDLSPAGLKDKHASTRQLFSATAALRPETGDPRLKIRFVGKAAAPLTAACITGNAFRLVVRCLRDVDARRLAANAEVVKRVGLPNYYDDQRFGGNAHGQGFIGRALAQGNFEEAVRLHLAAPHRKQNLTDKQNRRLARDLWGNWAELHQRMRKSPERALVEFLRDHPGQWVECFERITPPLRNMFVAAYQSLLFNETLARFVAASGLPVAAQENRGGSIPMHCDAPTEVLARWRELRFPLPGPETRLADCPEAAPHLQAVLEQQGIMLPDLRLAGLQRTRFMAAERAILLFPKDLNLAAPEADDLNPGRLKVALTFSLPRGSFATMVVKRLAADCGSAG